MFAAALSVLHGELYVADGALLDNLNWALQAQSSIVYHADRQIGCFLQPPCYRICMYNTGVPCSNMAGKAKQPTSKVCLCVQRALLVSVAAIKQVLTQLQL